MTNRERAENLLRHYLRLACTRAGVAWNEDNDAEVGVIVDALRGMVVDEIRDHARRARVTRLPGRERA